MLLKDTRLSFQSGKTQIFDKWKMTNLTRGYKEDQIACGHENTLNIFQHGDTVNLLHKKEAVIYIVCSQPYKNVFEEEGRKKHAKMLIMLLFGIT